MKVGVLEDKVQSEALDVLMEHESVRKIQQFDDGTFGIESNDLNSLHEWMAQCGLCLVVSGEHYRMGVIVEDIGGLASMVGKAVTGGVKKLGNITKSAVSAASEMASKMMDTEEEENITDQEAQTAEVLSKKAREIADMYEIKGDKAVEHIVNALASSKE